MITQLANPRPIRILSPLSAAAFPRISALFWKMRRSAFNRQSRPDIDTLYIVTPFADQQTLVKDILEHWQTGHGASYNPKRKEALSLVRICHDLAELYALVEAKWQQRPAVLATSAKPQARALGFAEARQRILAGEPHLILFGTGWGMTPEVLADVDGLLPPIAGFSEYNHLSVRRLRPLCWTGCWPGSSSKRTLPFL